MNVDAACYDILRVRQSIMNTTVADFMTVIYIVGRFDARVGTTNLNSIILDIISFSSLKKFPWLVMISIVIMNKTAKTVRIGTWLIATNDYFLGIFLAVLILVMRMLLLGRRLSYVAIFISLMLMSLFVWWLSLIRVMR